MLFESTMNPLTATYIVYDILLKPVDSYVDHSGWLHKSFDVKLTCEPHTEPDCNNRPHLLCMENMEACVQYQYYINWFDMKTHKVSQTLTRLRWALLSLVVG
jgi:hypothetical protein